ncbi:hypothetical protein LG634_18015 [Streptomyces bambusae]|uniref:hypothetical protein n=1 Tax=Streptomyces bambusae TaxID=1550616 RepID=UPI001CFC76B7|nr:hypothetical protein [Streptomyces bambusae]MCB5166728.1 hypothetical protein [Streptomyces bambusae]
MSDPRIPYSQGPAPDSDGDYSATVLGSHWFDGPGDHPDTVRTTRQLPVPDRVEGAVLRFGPGVTAAVPRPRGFDGTTLVWHGAPPPPEPVRRGGLRRYALACAVLLAVLCYLGWQRYGPAMEVHSVRVSAPADGPACDSAAEITALVRTDGRPGTLAYRWVRNDGTRSETLTERVPSGQRETRLRLLWTFRGRGEYRAEVRVEVLSPLPRTAGAEFTYRCG